MDSQELETRIKVRFRRTEGSKYTYGKYLGIVKKDSSLTIVDNGGNIRSIEPEYVEYEVKGPRGGRSWKKYSEQETP